ncbi:MAG: amidohydrolase [Eubacteriales bacterium]|nr:amidohydrolase [Eubacteriales bacterium]
MDIYYGGTVLTMEEETDREGKVNAVCVEKGRIIFVGEEQEARQRFPQAEFHNLRGGVMMPAFIDAHSHLSSAASESLQIALENVRNMKQLREVLLEYVDRNQIKPGVWIRAKGFDHNQMEEKAFPDLEFLDKLLPDNPFLLQHKSGHMGVLNSIALEKLGITADTPSPKGGLIGKRDGRLTGYMEENAFIECLKKIGGPELNQFMDAIEEMQDKYASYGITTVQEGMMASQMIPLYRELMHRRYLKLDVVGYGDVNSAEEFREAFESSIGKYDRNFKLGGYKIFLDGSPQGRTAWMLEPYEGEEEYCGYGTLTDSQVLAAVKKAADTNMQLLAHCNGDAAADQYIRMAEKAAAEGYDIESMRLVMIHAQLLRREQMKEVKDLGMIPSFFVAHVYHWGDVHRENFGEKRASEISPAGTALKYEIPFTFHQDNPVIEPDMLETVWCAVNRTTREGRILGQEECIPVYEALKAVTINAAHQYFEENEKGSVREGKWADLVVLDKNPLKVPKEEIKNIRVMATYRHGVPVYRR